MTSGEPSEPSIQSWYWYYRNPSSPMVLTTSEILGCVFLYVNGVLSSSAGIGGGILNVAIFLLAFGSSFHEATVFSMSVLAGNYLSQVQSIFSWRPYF